MKILFVAPLPPPITGQSIATKILLDDLESTHDMAIVDFSKQSFKEGITNFRRIFEIIHILREIWKRRNNADVIYITISESMAGNIKDLFIYLICFRKISRVYIHLHGGSIKRLLWDKYRLLSKINSFFIKRMGGAVITGKSHLTVFSGILPSNRIHIVPNFAQDYLFVDEEAIRQNFSSKTIRVLYMSNLIPKKGYNELADAYLSMPPELRSKIQVDFAGGFESAEEKNIFLKKIEGFDGIKYHGVVINDEKQKLFSRAHIFCLPTAYFEGQPISILEAYASGCVVITTGQSGILDIFEDEINGFEIQPQSSSSIVQVLNNIIDKTLPLQEIALLNFRTALEKYRMSIFSKALREILESNDSKI